MIASYDRGPHIHASTDVCRTHAQMQLREELEKMKKRVTLASRRASMDKKLVCTDSV